MEQQFTYNDITYSSELTLDIKDVKGSIRTATYVHLRSISRVLIKKGEI